jgi:hypothetical protein
MYSSLCRFYDFQLGGFVGRIMYMDILDVGNKRMLNIIIMQKKVNLLGSRLERKNNLFNRNFRKRTTYKDDCLNLSETTSSSSTYK